MAVLYKLRSLRLVRCFEYGNPVRMPFIASRGSEHRFKDVRANLSIPRLTEELFTFNEWNNISGKTVNRPDSNRRDR